MPLVAVEHICRAMHMRCIRIARQKPEIFYRNTSVLRRGDLRAVVSAFWAFLSSRHISALYCFYCIVSVLINKILIHSFIHPSIHSFIQILPKPHAPIARRCMPFCSPQPDTSLQKWTLLDRIRRYCIACCARSRPSFHLNYTAWWQGHKGVNNLPRVVRSRALTGNWAHDLIIVSPTAYHCATTPRHRRGNNNTK